MASTSTSDTSGSSKGDDASSIVASSVLSTVGSGCCTSGDTNTNDDCCSNHISGNNIKDSPAHSSGNCCSSHNDYNGTKKDSQVATNTNNLLGIILENKYQMIVYDSMKQPKIFELKGNTKKKNNKIDLTKLCFQAHGGTSSNKCSSSIADSTSNDLLITSCFKKDPLGNFIHLDEDDDDSIDDDETCFCGIDNPHMHAHLHNSSTCANDDSDTANVFVKNVEKLLTHILVPINTDDNNTTMMHMNISDQLPNVCNNYDSISTKCLSNVTAATASTAEEIVEEKSSQDGTKCCNDTTNSCVASNTVINRYYNCIQHGTDHVDQLVHNITTGQLHLEHTGCTDHDHSNHSHHKDVHGIFECIGHRQLNASTKLHFYKVPDRPFRGLIDVLDHLTTYNKNHTHLFNTNTDTRVQIALDVSDTKNLISGTSIGTAINSCHKDMSSIVPSTDCNASNCGNKGGYAVEASKSAAATTSSPKKRSQLHIQSGMCCASEIPAIRKIITPILVSAATTEFNDDSIAVNVTTKMLYIDTFSNTTTESTDVDTTSIIQNVCAALNTAGFGTKIIIDGTALSNVDNNKNLFVTSTFQITTLMNGSSTVPVCAKKNATSSGCCSPKKKTTSSDCCSNSATSKSGCSSSESNATSNSASGCCSSKSNKIDTAGIADCCSSKKCGNNEKTVTTTDCCGSGNKKSENYSSTSGCCSSSIKNNDTSCSSGGTSAGCCSSNTNKDRGDVDDDTVSTNSIPTKVSKYLLAVQTSSNGDIVQTFQMMNNDTVISITHNPFRVTSDQLRSNIMNNVDTSTGKDHEQHHLATTIHILIDGADPNLWDYPQSLAKQIEKLDDGADMEEYENGEGITYPRPTVIISGILWVISMFSLIDSESNWHHLKWVALVSVAFGIPPIALKAFRTMRRCQFDTNCLMLFASVGAVALQDYTEAAAVVFLFALSEWLEIRATTRARFALAAIVQLRPDRAYLVHPSSKEIFVVSATAVPIGGTVSVKTGDKIPCDGVVIDGTSTVDESSLTGESRPIRKTVRDKVSGGTVNSGRSPLLVQTTASSDDSAVSRLIRLVEEAQANRSDTEKLVDEFAKYYTPVVVLAALCMCTFPWIVSKEAGELWTHNGLILIVVACPCALIISTPVSYVAGLAATAQKGVLIKGGATLEALSGVKHICFDKTGTLTNGKFALLHLDIVGNGLSRHEVLQILTVMEERASHPVAQAILAAAANEKIFPNQMSLKKHKIVNGEGVTGIVDDREVNVGNERMFERLQLLTELSSDLLRKVTEWKSVGGTIGFMSVEGHGIVCAFCAADSIRPESAGAIKKLKQLGIKITMLTGDNADAAIAIGAQAGLEKEEIKSKMLPEEKLAFVEGLATIAPNSSCPAFCNPCKKKSLVLMCGDGVNDAPALAAANVGVAMGEGAALSMETSDVTLLDSNLDKVQFSIRMGQRVTSKIIQNVIFSLVVKFIMLGFALSGKTDLWAAIASDVGAMLIVTLNAMLLLPKRQKRVSAIMNIVDSKFDVEEQPTKN